MPLTPRLPGSPEWIVDELRNQALREALEIGADEEDMLECEAAELIVRYETALRSIAAGDGPAKAIAKKALDHLGRLTAAADAISKIT